MTFSYFYDIYDQVVEDSSEIASARVLSNDDEKVTSDTSNTSNNHSRVSHKKENKMLERDKSHNSDKDESD